LRGSIVNSGLDPDKLPESDPSKMSFGGGEGSKAKAWKEIWGCGQGIGAIREVLPAAELIARLASEYAAAKRRLGAAAAVAA
jgi:nitronate monooxygenase